MTYAMMKSKNTAAGSAGTTQLKGRPTQVTSPAFASVHGAAQTVVIVRRS